MTKIGQARGLNEYNGEQIYYAARAELHHCMVHSSAGYAGPVYGVLLTSKYLLPIKREGSRYGELYLGAAIPWSRSFENEEQVSSFTVQSALWYLSILASIPGWYYGGPTVRRTVRGVETERLRHKSLQGRRNKRNRGLVMAPFSRLFGVIQDAQDMVL